MKSYSIKLSILAILFVSSIFAAQIHLSPLEERFMQAAKNNNVRELKAAIDQQVNVLVRDDNGYQALHWAARGGNIDAVKLLLEAGANPEDIQNRESISPAEEAKRKRHPEIQAIITRDAQDQAVERPVIRTYTQAVNERANFKPRDF